jgi:ribonuclease HI
MNTTFECQKCNRQFSIPQQALEKYPGWTPRTCMACRENPKKTKPKKAKRGKSITTALNLSVEEVLAKYDGGPKSGLFTDGGAQPNPGPGGWGAVYVEDNNIVTQRYGHEPDTTNNRMELTALIEGYKMIPPGRSTSVYTDSDLCVKTLSLWAKGWQARGWRRKTGPIKNLELVKEAHALYLARPELKLQWIKAHDGSRWNEYVDALASAWTRDKP